ncbi:hypothetical protein AKJ09_01175 [Labilithrix luteola]|uniref:Uncharacterized protein n=1 Tax=Labilithrix luteola TaxID=1391654 RepID=A0A0K1PM83_9BACT|nr:hypothetical protein AKJ09_01175 [Labilithrix luteola]
MAVCVAPMSGVALARYGERLRSSPERAFEADEPDATMRPTALKRIPSCPSTTLLLTMCVRQQR